jgi:hypothetical protein
MVLTTGNLVYLISTKGARRVWLVSRGCLLLLSTWSYLSICRGSVLPTHPSTRFCICLFDYDYVLHILNFAIFFYFHLWHKQSLSDIKDSTSFSCVLPEGFEYCVCCWDTLLNSFLCCFFDCLSSVVYIQVSLPSAMCYQQSRGLLEIEERCTGFRVCRLL